MNKINAFLAGSVLMVLTLNLLKRFIWWINQPRIQGPYVIEKGDLVTIDSEGYARKVKTEQEIPVGFINEAGSFQIGPIMIKARAAENEEVS